MKQLGVATLTTVIALAMPTIAKADNIMMITLNPNTANQLMPLINRLILGQIVSAIILGILAVKCCTIFKNKS